MKKKLFKLLTFLLIIPALLLCACSGNRSKFSAINISRYFESVVRVTYGDDNGRSRQIDIGEIASSKLNKSNLSNYYSFEIEGNAVWLYKMYIDCIYFSVYTTDTANTGNGLMTLTITITNLVDEEILKNDGDLTKIEPTVIQVNISPKKDNFELCRVDINKTVATSTGVKITIDIRQSADNTILDKSKNFTWFIYDFNVYGESRAYN